jgi:hypothetical protein
MLPTKIRFIWPTGFRGDFKKSTKSTIRTITFLLHSLNTKKITTYDIGIPGPDLGSQPSPLDNWISNGNTYINNLLIISMIQMGSPLHLGMVHIKLDTCIINRLLFGPLPWEDQIHLHRSRYTLPNVFFWRLRWFLGPADCYFSELALTACWFKTKLTSTPHQNVACSCHDISEKLLKWR